MRPSETEIWLSGSVEQTLLYGGLKSVSGVMKPIQ